MIEIRTLSAVKLYHRILCGKALNRHCVHSNAILNIIQLFQFHSSYVALLKKQR